MCLPAGGDSFLIYRWGICEIRMIGLRFVFKLTDWAARGFIMMVMICADKIIKNPSHLRAFRQIRVIRVQKKATHIA